MSIAVVGNLSKRDVYESKAKLLVRLGRESVSIDPTATTGEFMNVNQSRESEINSELDCSESSTTLEYPKILEMGLKIANLELRSSDIVNCLINRSLRAQTRHWLLCASMTAMRT